MANSKYLPKDHNQRFFRAIEEAGEFLQAAGKAGRWGMDNFNPDVPPDRRETNAAWVKREMLDLRAALDALEPDIDAEIERQQQEGAA